MSIFGRYRWWLDESIQILLSISVAGFGYLFGLSLNLAIICLVCGVILDIDHIFNLFFIKKVIGVNDYRGGVQFGGGGYTVKILHGIDVAFLLGLVTVLSYHNFVFSVTLSLALITHELWDFVVYPHRWTELFLITRAYNRFRPGERTRGLGVFFDKGSLKY